MFGQRSGHVQYRSRGEPREDSRAADCSKIRQRVGERKEGVSLATQMILQALASKHNTRRRGFYLPENGFARFQRNAIQIADSSQKQQL
jgi:hypothetical protein